MERRTYELIEDCRGLTRFHEFMGAKSIGRARSRVDLPGERVREDERHFITSLHGPDAVNRFAPSVRNHWGI